MDPEQDPFAVFEAEQADLLGQPKKKVHVDPLAHIDSAIMASRLNPLDLQDQPDSDQEAANKNKLEDVDIQVERTDDGCIHQVFYPKGYARHAYLGPCNAKEYPFKLDAFQEKAVRAI